jgi:peptidoglycan/xylan/chitin deacetylase (PgdA/CDA1 family)
MKRLLVRVLYGCGLLGLYHRLRNQRALTVISLHRVLAVSDPRWQTCDPLYTMSDRLFDQCVQFFSRHYSVVSLAELEAARQSGSRLPRCPLLITFDDGWADNYQYALPILRRRKLPAALFVASDVLGRREAFFQERMIGAWRRGRLASTDLAALWNALGSPPPDNVLAQTNVQALIARLQSLPVAERGLLLERIGYRLEDEQRQMLTSQELRDMANDGFGVGTHGKAHEALTTVSNPDVELSESKLAVAAAMQVRPETICSLSFPFSKQNAAVIARARATGYKLLFGGGLSLTPLDPVLPDLLARVAVDAAGICDDRGNFSPSLLAAYLFRRPHRMLQPG